MELPGTISKKLLWFAKQAILSDDNLKDLYHSCTIGSLATGGYYPEFHVTFSQLVNENSPMSIVRDYNDHLDSSICFCTTFSLNFNADTIKKLQKENQKIIIPRFEFSLEQTCVNLNKDLLCKYRAVTFSVLKNKIIPLFQRNVYYSNPILKLYFAGSKHVFIGMSLSNGQLFIRTQSIDQLIKYNSNEDIKMLLKDLFLNHYDFYRLINSSDISIFKQGVRDTCMNAIMNKYGVSTRFESRLSQIVNEPISEQEKTERIMQCFELYLNSNVLSKFDSCIFGAHDSYSYSHLITQVMNSNKQQAQMEYSNGFKAGMSIGLKMEMLGWRPTTVNFPDSTNFVWWYKDVNIIPDTIYYMGHRYSVNKNYKLPYKVTKLYVSSAGILKCDGQHPNVNGSSVCMGDLSIVFHGSVSALEDSLKRAETLLDMINYDSAYSSTDREKIIENCTLSTPLNLKNNKLKSTDSVKEISFSDDDDDDDDVEIVEEESKDSSIQSLDYYNHNIGEIRELDTPNIPRIYNGDLPDESIDSDTEHITQVNSNQENYHIITEDGSTIPETLQSESNTIIERSNTDDISVSVIGELMLSDQNLIRGN